MTAGSSWWLRFEATAELANRVAPPPRRFRSVPDALTYLSAVVAGTPDLGFVRDRLTNRLVGWVTSYGVTECA